MNDTAATDVAVVIVTYNSEPHLDRTLAALRGDPAPPKQVVVIDNASVDRTLEIAGRHDVDLVPLDKNVGFAKACHIGVERTKATHIAFLNPDASPVDGWLPPLIGALKDPTVGAAMPTIALADAPDRYNTSGGVLTYVGLAWVSDMGEPVAPTSEPVTVAFPSGAAMAMTRRLWNDLGGFRTDFFMYLEDADLGWRLALRGLRTVRVPASRVLHAYDFSRNPDKFRHLETNRIAMVAANYRRSTRLLLAPALLLTELGVLVVAVRDRWLGQKFGAWRTVLGTRHDRAHRDAVQRSRTVGDATILAGMGTRLDGGLAVETPRLAGLANVMLAWWLRLVLPVVRRIDRRLGFD